MKTKVSEEAARTAESYTASGEKVLQSYKVKWGDSYYYGMELGKKGFLFFAQPTAYLVLNEDGSMTDRKMAEQIFSIIFSYVSMLQRERIAHVKEMVRIGTKRNLFGELLEALDMLYPVFKPHPLFDEPTEKAYRAFMEVTRKDISLDHKILEINREFLTKYTEVEKSGYIDGELMHRLFRNEVQKGEWEGERIENAMAIELARTRLLTFVENKEVLQPLDKAQRQAVRLIQVRLKTLKASDPQNKSQMKKEIIGGVTCYVFSPKPEEFFWSQLKERYLRALKN